MSVRTTARIVLAVLTVGFLYACLTVHININSGFLFSGEVLLGLAILDVLAIFGMIAGIAAAVFAIGFLLFLAFGDES